MFCGVHDNVLCLYFVESVMMSVLICMDRIGTNEECRSDGGQEMGK